MSLRQGRGGAVSDSAGAKVAAEAISAFGRRVTDNVTRVIVGKDDVIRLVLVALLCEGHVLVEDVPVGLDCFVQVTQEVVGPAQVPTRVGVVFACFLHGKVVRNWRACS